MNDLSWLRSRGYAEPSALKLVGDRYQLRQRQRVAVGRCACAEARRVARAAKRVQAADVEGRVLAIDGLNVVTTIEVALARGVLLLGRDQCMRDMASFHGSYRLVHETKPALTILVDLVRALRPTHTVVYIDRPVSNSGRLAEALRAAARAGEVGLEAETADDVDGTLKRAEGVVASADSAILDVCGAWLPLARLAVERHRDAMPPLWLVDLS